MKASRGWTLAALLAMAAAGPALAQSAGAGTSAGGSVGGSGSGSAGTAASASGSGSAGTTGVVTGSGSGSAATTATHVAPADGSNALAQPGMAATPEAALAGRIVLPGAVVAQAGTSESADGSTRTVVTHYWVNVPAGVEQHAGFQRWQRLR